jgi:hypothetical protein
MPFYYQMCRTLTRFATRAAASTGCLLEACLKKSVCAQAQEAIDFHKTSLCDPGVVGVAPRFVGEKHFELANSVFP